MKKYEVTIKFRNIPWYTGYAMADSSLQAKLVVHHNAKAQGFTGISAGMDAVEVKEESQPQGGGK